MESAPNKNPVSGLPSADAVRNRLRREASAVFETHDAILAPISPVAAATDSGVFGASSTPVASSGSRRFTSTQRMKESTSSPRWLRPTVRTQTTPVPPLLVEGVSDFGGCFSSCVSLAAAPLEGIRQPVSFWGCALSRSAIVEP